MLRQEGNTSYKENKCEAPDMSQSPERKPCDELAGAAVSSAGQAGHRGTGSLGEIS